MLIIKLGWRKLERQGQEIADGLVPSLKAITFKPRGIPLSVLEEVILTLDEFEAIRLTDLEGLYQEQGAEKMNVSRPTFGRIIDSAKKRRAEGSVNGKALKIEGGEFDEVECIGDKSI